MDQLLLQRSTTVAWLGPRLNFERNLLGHLPTFVWVPDASSPWDRLNSFV